MQTSGITSQKNLKHGAIAGIATVLVIYILGFVFPSLSNGVQLSTTTLFAIFLGAMVGAMVVVKDLTKNLFFDGFVGGATSVGVTAVVYVIFGAANAIGPLVAVLFVASFISTIVVKKMNK